MNFAIFFILFWIIVGFVYTSQQLDQYSHLNQKLWFKILETIIVAPVIVFSWAVYVVNKIVAFITK